MTATSAQDEVALARQRVGSDLCGRWPLDKLIGFGGMAAVYASRDAAGTPVAIKILHSTYSTNESIRQRFIREAQLTQAVQHEGSVAVYEQGQSEEGDPYFVMELLQGVTLDKLWKQHKKVLPPRDALAIAERVLAFLAVCHGQGIVHRDLKPANIFVTDAGAVKVIDFGVARRREAGVDPTMAGTALGTPAYMAPEQALGSQDRIDGRTDLFAVGAVLHAMVSGQRLHEGRSMEEAFVLAATRPAPSVSKVAPDLAPELVALIDRALQWDPRNRFQSADEMRAAISAILDTPRNEAPRKSEPPKRHGRASLLAAMAESGEAPEAEAELGPEEQAHLAQMQEIFRRVERSLNAVRQYESWHHKVTQGHMQTIHELIRACAAALPHGLAWEIRPHSFTLKNAVLWEPLHPFDEIPYNLFASGFRSFAITDGVTLEEIVSLLDLMRRDPLRDFSPEDDLATAFWERQLEHVRYEVVSSFLTVGSTEEEDREYEELFESGKDLLEQPVERARASTELDTEPASLEEKAALIAARQVALRAVRSAGAAALDERSRALVAAALEIPEPEWEARYVRALSYAVVDALTHGDLELVATPLRVAIHEAALGRTLAVALRRTLAIIEAVSLRGGAGAGQQLASSLIDAETLGALLKELARPVPEAERESVAAAAPLLAQLLDETGAEHFDAVLAALGRADVEPVHDALLRYLERHAVGREEQIAALLAEAELAKGRAILGLLRRLGTEAAARALKAAESSSLAELRVEAVAMRAQASVEGMRDELSRLLADRSPAVRMAVLATMARYKVKEAGPLLVQLASDDSFHKLGADERRSTLATLWELSPARAESLLEEIASKSGMLTREAVDDTRTLAIELLERLSSNPAVVEVLDKIAGKWTNSQMVRDAAAQAAASLKRRLGVR